MDKKEDLHQPLTAKSLTTFLTKPSVRFIGMPIIGFTALAWVYAPKYISFNELGESAAKRLQEKATRVEAQKFRQLAIGDDLEDVLETSGEPTSKNAMVWEYAQKDGSKIVVSVGPNQTVAGVVHQNGDAEKTLVSD